MKRRPARRSQDARTPAAPARMRYRSVAAWLFTLPGLAAQLLFGWLPVLYAFVVGFQRYYFVKPPQYLGLRNFANVAADPLTLTSFENTLYYSALSIALTFLIPIFVSILLMEM